MPSEGYMDAGSGASGNSAGIDTPGAEDDTLRERLATALTGLPPTAIYSDGTIKIVAEPVIDELMPVIRDHVAAAVQGERERAAEILDGCNERTAELAERIDVLATDVMEREAAVQRVRALATGRRGFTAADVLAALDGTEAEHG